MENKNERRKEQILRMSGVNPKKCMRCGKCSATCPAYDEMEYHPHQFVYMVESGDITQEQSDAISDKLEKGFFENVDADKIVFTVGKILSYFTFKKEK